MPHTRARTGPASPRTLARELVAADRLAAPSSDDNGSWRAGLASGGMRRIIGRAGRDTNPPKGLVPPRAPRSSATQITVSASGGSQGGADRVIERHGFDCRRRRAPERRSWKRLRPSPAPSRRRRLSSRNPQHAQLGLQSALLTSYVPYAALTTSATPSCRASTSSPSDRGPRSRSTRLCRRSWFSGLFSWAFDLLASFGASRCFSLDTNPAPVLNSS